MSRPRRSVVARWINQPGRWTVSRTWLVAAAALWSWSGVASSAGAQEWARAMFPVHSHDFGTVARGAKAEYDFKFKNLYKETVHIAGVRVSCGCTSARVVNDTVDSLQTGKIRATFNTRSFLGRRGATITVIFDRPYYAEVRLQVGGYVRRDIVCEPGQVDFGSIDAGTAAERHIQITYAGRTNWRIVDVRSPNEHVEVELQEIQRNGGRVSYDMTVRLKETAPPGLISSPLDIVSDDTQLAAVRLEVSARVLSPLTVASSLVLGTLPKDGETTKNLIVRSKTPCKITGVECDDKRFEFDVPKTAKKVHVIRVKFHAGSEAGPVDVPIRIVSDLAGELFCQCVATGSVE